ncbi:hypothetical protein U1Q18_022421, partial [Sarracenia purpurea var. burkii]
EDEGLPNQGQRVRRIAVAQGCVDRGRRWTAWSVPRWRRGGGQNSGDGGRGFRRRWRVNLSMAQTERGCRRCRFALVRWFEVVTDGGWWLLVAWCTGVV